MAKTENKTETKIDKQEAKTKEVAKPKESAKSKEAVKENKPRAKQEKTKSMLFTLNLVLAVITLVLVLLLIGGIIKQDSNIVASFLGASIISQIVVEILLFFVYKKLRDTIRIIIVSVFYLVAAVLAFVGLSNYILFYVANALIALAEAINQFFLIEKEKTKRGAITNILIGVTLVALCIGIFFNITEENKLNISFVTVILLSLNVLRKILFPSLKFEKIRLLVDILVKTHTIDVFIGLIAFIIVFSFIFPLVEEGITNFWDAMWYCFAVVTTIGFGDITAVTMVGRVLTVILGFYGIVVVAIMTSVIVNFYNELSKKEKARDVVE